VHSAGAL
jgi:hypothetical protein